MNDDLSRTGPWIGNLQFTPGAIVGNHVNVQQLAAVSVRDGDKAVFGESSDLVSILHIDTSHGADPQMVTDAVVNLHAAMRTYGVWVEVAGGPAHGLRRWVNLRHVATARGHGHKISLESATGKTLGELPAAKAKAVLDMLGLV